MGRRTEFTQAIADTICDRLAEGQSLRAICATAKMPCQVTVFKWLSQQPEFAKQYARARESQVEHYAEEILEIADDGRNDTYEKEDGTQATNQDVIARSRLRVDTRKWLMSKLAPKKYGDKLELGGDANAPINVIHRVERVIVRPAAADGRGIRSAPGAEPV